MQPKRPALGKGLSALIPDALEQNGADAGDAQPPLVRSSSSEVDIDRLTPNDF